MKVLKAIVIGLCLVAGASAQQEEPPREWIERVRAIRPSGNAHQLKLALRRPLVDEGCLIAGIAGAVRGRCRSWRPR